MREDEAGRQRTSWRTYPGISRFTSAVAHLSAAAVFALDAAGGFAARKGRSKNNGDESGKNGEDTGRNQDGGRHRDRQNRHDERRNQDNGKDKDQETKGSTEDGSGGGRNRESSRQNADNTSDVSAEAKKDKNSTTDTTNTDTNNKKNNNSDTSTTDETTDTTTDTTTTDETTDTTAVDEGGGGGGGRAGNAGSDFFDSPLATKARRRADEFGGQNLDEEDGIIVDADPEGTSFYETDGISLVIGPDGIDILTRNIDYVAAPPLEPEPLPRLELPVRDRLDLDLSGADVVIASPARGNSTAEPVDSGDTGGRVRTPLETQSSNSDGGDYTMDFVS